MKHNAKHDGLAECKWHRGCSSCQKKEHGYAWIALILTLAKDALESLHAVCALVRRERAIQREKERERERERERETLGGGG